MDKYDLVIVGAGISGLYCAYHLQKQFPKILIIEKDDRIGGRIFTQKIVANNKQVYIELGANRFSIHHTKVMKLINDLKLSKFVSFEVSKTSSVSLETSASINVGGKNCLGDLVAYKNINCSNTALSTSLL